MEVGDPHLPTAQPSRGTLLRGAGHRGFAYGAITLYGGPFQASSATAARPAGVAPRREGSDPSSPYGCPAGNWFGLSPFRSPLLRGSRLISLPAPTKMFPFGAFPPLTGRAGLFALRRRSHSGIPGSAAACAYPGHFAACRALPRRPSRAIHRTATAPQGPGISQVPLVGPGPDLGAGPIGWAALIGPQLRGPSALRSQAKLVSCIGVKGSVGFHATGRPTAVER